MPYSMLAEELMQFARRRWWNADAGVWRDADFDTTCTAARVMCRLAVLHADPDYTRTAIVAAGTDYARDAERTLASLSSEYRNHDVEAAVYGLAVEEWLALGPPSRLQSAHPPEAHWLLIARR
jgi:hypothetical protein